MSVEGWDISTASYTGKKLDVSSEENYPSGIFFKTDGTIMYIDGNGSNTVYQYQLSTPWDISTAKYTGKKLDVSDAPSGISFKPDGTIVYIGGYFSGKIYQYTLTTPWDISTAKYTGKSFTCEVDRLEGLFFKPDGAIMYSTDFFHGKIYQYELSTPWDISTAKYTGKSLDISDQDEYASGIFFRPDGVMFYVVGHFSGVYQYKLASLVIDISSFNLTSKPEKAFKEPVKVYVSFEKNKDRCLCKDEDISSKIKNATTNSFEFVDNRKNILETGDDLICNGENVKVSKVEAEGGNVFGLIDSGNDDYLHDITTDSNGNVYVCGYSHNGTNYDHYIAKFDKDLNLVKQITIDSGNTDCLWDITTDSNGNVYVCGHSNYNHYIAKFDKDLNLIKQITIDSGNTDILYSITTDSNGNVYVCGHSHNGTNDNHYIAKFDKDLNLIKQITIDSGNYDYLYSITTDSNGNVYVCGHVRTGSNYNQFIAKLNPDLEFNTTTFKLNNITFNIKEVSYPVTEQSWTPTEQSWIPHKQSWTPIEHTWTPKTVNYPYYKYVDGYKIKVDIDKTLSSTISSVIIPNRSEEQELEKREYDSTNDKIISTYKAITKAEKPGRAIKFRVDGVKDTEVDEVAIDLWSAQTT